MGRRLAGGAAGAALAVFVGLAVAAARRALRRRRHRRRILDLDDAQLHGTITPPGADTRHATAELEPPTTTSCRGTRSSPRTNCATRYFKTRLFGPVEDVGRTYNAARRRDGGPRRQVGRAAHLRRDRRGHGVRRRLRRGRGPAADHGAAARARPRRGVRAGGHRARPGSPTSEMARLYGYTEEEWQAQIDRLPKVYGQPGADIVKILDAYVEGINEYIALAARGEVPLPAGLRRPRHRGARAVEDHRRGGGRVHGARAVRRGRRQRDEQRRGARRAREGPRRRAPAARSTTTSAAARTATGRCTPRSASVTWSATRRRSIPRPPPVGRAPDRRSRGAARCAADSQTHCERLKLSTPLGAIDLSHPGSMSNHLVVGALALGHRASASCSAARRPATSRRRSSWTTSSTRPPSTRAARASRACRRSW